MSYVEPPEVEDKVYGPDLTQEDIDLIRAQIFKVEDSKIYYREIPKLSEVQLEVSFSRLEELLVETPSLKTVVLDISNTSMPDPKHRDILHKKWAQVLPYVKHISVITGDNLLVKTSSKFIAASLGLENYSFHSSRDEVL